MERVEAYKCEICGRIYDNEEVAKRCETAHNRIVEIKPKWFGFSPIPPFIEVKFCDGKIEKYQATSKGQEEVMQFLDYDPDYEYELVSYDGWEVDESDLDWLWVEA